MIITENDLSLIEKRLAVDLFRLSSGKLNESLSKKVAHQAMKDIDFNNSALAHKGTCWFATQIIDAINFNAA